MPDQTNAANGKTMIQRSELATMRKGSMKIAFMPFFFFASPVDFRLESSSHLLCYPKATRMPPLEKAG
jgi:hypothetical protein